MEETGIVRVGSEEISIAIEKIPQTAREMAALFVSEQDIRQSSRALYLRTLSQFFKWIEEQHFPLGFIEALNTLSVSDINRYKESLLQRLSSKLSVCSYLIVVRKFYEWAEAKKWYPNIAKGIKTPPRKEAFRKEHLSKEKSKELLKYFKTDRKRKKTEKTRKPLPPEALCRDYAIVFLMLKTGLRTIEITRADVGDIVYRREKRVLKVWGKGRSDKEEDFIVLTEETYAPIQEYLSKYRKGAKPGEPLFTSVSLQNKGQRLTTRTISGICKEGLRKINLDAKEYTAHCLRHTAAVALIKVGADITEVQAMLRHASIDTSRIYLKSIETEERLLHPSEAKLDGYFI